MAINDLSQNAVLIDSDIIPIFDSENGRTRAVLASTVSKYIDSEYAGKHVVSGSLNQGVLTLTFTDESTIDIDGFVYDTTDLPDMPQTLEAGKVLKVNPTGDGYILVSEPSIGGEIEVYNGGILAGTVGGINVEGDLFGPEVNGVTTLSVIGQPSQTGEVNELYTYDPSTSRLIKTGVKVVNGSIETSAGSVKIGNHKISSSGQNVAFRNESTEKVYVPPWSEINEIDDADPVRVVFTSQFQDIVRNADQSSDVDDPEWFIPGQVEDEVLFRLTLTNVVNSAGDVFLYGYENGQEIFRESLGELSPGENNFIFKDPLFIKNTEQVKISILSENGTVTVKGDSSGTPAYSVRIRNYIEKKLITIDDIDLELNDLNDVDAPDPSEEDVLVYKNAQWQSLPTPPGFVGTVITDAVVDGGLRDLKSNFIHTSLSSNFQIGTPKGAEGAILWIYNDSDTNTVTLNPANSDSVDGSISPYVVQGKTEVQLSYDDLSSNWFVVFSAKINTETIIPVKQAPNEAPTVQAKTFTFPNASVFEGDDPNDAYIDTAFGASDGDGNEVQDTIEVKIVGAEVEAENIPNRVGRRAVFTIPDNGIQASDDGVNYSKMTKLFVSVPPFSFNSEIGDETSYTLGFIDDEFYIKPVNAMYQLSSVKNIPAQNDQEPTLFYFDDPLVSDRRIIENTPTNGWTLEAVKSIPTQYFIRAEIFSDDLILNPPNGELVEMSFAIVDMDTFIPGAGANPIFDISNDELEVIIRAHKNQPFGRHVIEGIISVSGTPTKIGVQLLSQLGDTVSFQPNSNSRITIYQINDPDNKASIADLYENQLNGGVSQQQSFVLGGDFLSQPFDIGATTDTQTLQQGEQVRVANGWWLDAVADNCNYRRTSEGLQLEDGGGQSIFLPELHHVVSGNITDAFSQRNERVTFTAKIKYDEPAYLYVLGWTGVRDSVDPAILTSYQNEQHIWSPDIQVLGSQELFKEGIGTTTKTASVTVTIPASISNLIVSITTKQELNTITVEAVKGEIGDKFTGFVTSDRSDNEPFAFGAAQVDLTDASYEFSSENVAETLPLNTLLSDPPNEPYISLNDAGDFLSFAQKGTYMFCYQAEVYRENTTGGEVQYGIWLESSTDEGSSWDAIPGSAQRISVGKGAVGSVQTICNTFPFVTDSTDITLVRGRHAVTSISAGIELRSHSETALFPVAPAWRFSGYKF